MRRRIAAAVVAGAAGLVLGLTPVGSASATVAGDGWDGHGCSASWRDDRHGCWDDDDDWGRGGNGHHWDHANWRGGDGWDHDDHDGWGRGGNGWGHGHGDWGHGGDGWGHGGDGHDDHNGWG
ncbi:hypothetical protein [Streptomyces bambusae]|uniref:Uncharacterized protein n=1 Tax=Streptomyces bambusae TaxID=1550616 RepID=A0ABS6Z964_9ACTN|nr:hypothetical protein [Streptomyces bambusae]MBW5483768.1 hypothetical protein [Streptomyces bambusae]